ncbi:hypothetical protein ACWIUD_11495 [Helicobacter sp. 23-1044]
MTKWGQILRIFISFAESNTLFQNNRSNGGSALDYFCVKQAR